MTNSNVPVSPIQASIPQLLKATGIALAGAAVLLVTTVMPAEYGVDPTGIGKALGLSALHAPEASAASPAGSAPKPEMAVIANEAPFQTQEMILVLQPDEGTEIKALMREGDSFVFTWKTEGGPVNFDMHGEPPNAGEEFSSYWRDKAQTSAHGNFIAPFEGTHGWYWRNRGSSPVTVTVRVSGFFEKLYKPG